jgi:hypothetical protein
MANMQAFKIELLMQDEEIDTSDSHMWQCAEGDGSVISYLLHTISKHQMVESLYSVSINMSVFRIYI